MELTLLMCCHKQYELVPPLWRPIQCGAALNPPVEGAVTDNSGDNISALNKYYCELTAHYFAYKNIDSDYYGFCHYRRFFGEESCTKLPYLALNDISSSTERLLKDEKYWQQLIASNDIIAPRSEDMGLPAKQHYITSRHHYEEDLSLFLDILAEKYPLLNTSAEEYLLQNRQYFCNMFIMDKAHFFEYCDMLFDILKEFDTKKTLHGDFQSDRTDGYLGEIFTGIYIHHCKKNNARIKELPRLDVMCGAKKRLAFKLLPPESKRRFAIKKLVKALQGDR